MFMYDGELLKIHEISLLYSDYLCNVVIEDY